MSMHIASLDKIPCYLLKLSSGNDNMGMSWADNSVKIWRNLPISNPKPDLYNINAHTKFGENPWCLLKLSSRNEKWTIERTTDGRTDGHMDVQRETIIPHHYCVAGYKTGLINAISIVNWIDTYIYICIMYICFYFAFLHKFYMIDVL